MNNFHYLKMSNVEYPGRLRIIECEACSYALAAEVDEQGNLLMDTRIKFNCGDSESPHYFFHED